MKRSKGRYFSDSVKKSITIKASQKKVWRKLSNLVGLDWLINAKKAIFLTKSKRGIGSIRKISFEDGSEIEEHIVLWNSGESFTYIATTGLPLRAYVATISIKSRDKKSTQVTWQTYINTKKMTTKQFKDFVGFLSSFYEGSLENLKVKIEDH